MITCSGKKEILTGSPEISTAILPVENTHFLFDNFLSPCFFNGKKKNNDLANFCHAHPNVGSYGS